MNFTKAQRELKEKYPPAVKLFGYSSDGLGAFWHKYQFRDEVRYYQNKLTLIDGNVQYLGLAPKPEHDHWYIAPKKGLTPIEEGAKSLRQQTIIKPSKPKPAPVVSDELYCYSVNGEDRYYAVKKKIEDFLPHTDVVYKGIKFGLPKTQKLTNKRLLSPIPLRIDVKPNEHQCCYCEISLTQEKYTREHLIPKDRGGKDTKANLRPCCAECNSEKSNMLLHTYIQFLNLLWVEAKPGTGEYIKLQTKIINANKLAKDIYKQ